MTPTEILKAARELISDEAHWCQGRFACDETGDEAYTTEPRACRWCALGAVWAVAPGTVGIGAAERFLDIASGETITDYNDNHTHAEVLAMFDKAIKMSEGQK